MTDCLFCKIRDGQVPADIIFEDDECLAFRDINPKAPVHFLVVPRRHIANLWDTTDADEGLLGRIQLKIPKIARARTEFGVQNSVEYGPGGIRKCITCTTVSLGVARLPALINNIHIEK